MTPTEFCYWLQGYFELRDDVPRGLTVVQSDKIERHLALVFQHSIDPSTEPDPEKAAELQATHDGRPQFGVRPDGKTYRC